MSSGSSSKTFNPSSTESGVKGQQKPSPEKERVAQKRKEVEVSSMDVLRDKLQRLLKQKEEQDMEAKKQQRELKAMKEEKAMEKESQELQASMVEQSSTMQQREREKLYRINPYWTPERNAEVRARELGGAAGREGRVGCAIIWSCGQNLCGTMYLETDCSEVVSSVLHRCTRERLFSGTIPSFEFEIILTQHRCQWGRQRGACCWERGWGTVVFWRRAWAERWGSGYGRWTGVGTEGRSVGTETAIVGAGYDDRGRESAAQRRAVCRAWRRARQSLLLRATHEENQRDEFADG